MTLSNNVLSILVVVALALSALAVGLLAYRMLRKGSRSANPPAETVKALLDAQAKSIQRLEGAVPPACGRRTPSGRAVPGRRPRFRGSIPASNLKSQILTGQAISTQHTISQTLILRLNFPLPIPPCEPTPPSCNALQPNATFFQSYARLPIQHWPPFRQATPIPRPIVSMK